MYRRISAVAAALIALLFVSPTPARAQDDDHATHKKGSIGFHETSSPLGVRWWFGSQKVGIDLGFGFGSTPSLIYADESLKNFAISGGVPIVLQSWPRVHVLFRPGISYETQQVEATAPPTAFDTEDETTLRITGEIEAEAFILENFSVSASTGIAYESFDPGFGADKENSFTSIGRNFTNVGFHVYLFH
jgi:hypothetical protein